MWWTISLTVRRNSTLSMDNLNKLTSHSMVHLNLVSLKWCKSSLRWCKCSLWWWLSAKYLLAQCAHSTVQTWQRTSATGHQRTKAKGATNFTVKPITHSQSKRCSRGKSKQPDHNQKQQQQLSTMAWTAMALVWTTTAHMVWVIPTPASTTMTATVTAIGRCKGEGASLAEGAGLAQERPRVRVSLPGLHRRFYLKNRHLYTVA